MKYTIKRTTQFKKDFKLAEKQGLDISKLKEVVTLLANGEALPDEYNDHERRGN